MIARCIKISISIYPHLLDNLDRELYKKDELDRSKLFRMLAREWINKQKKERENED